MKRDAEELREAFNGARGEFTDLFVYGTMMSDRHVALLLNRKVESEPAALNNYMKIVPPGAFFFIVRQNGAQVRGRLLKNLTPEEVARLDSFEDEGKLYYRKPVVIRDSYGRRRRCKTYVGNLSALQKAFAREILFEDRYSAYLERKIDQILSGSDGQETELARQALRELMGAAVDKVIESHFDGDYVCNYLMIRTFNDAKPPDLTRVFANPEISPYADRYMRFACRHIIFNRFVEEFRNHFHDAVRVSHKYFRHGIAILLGLLYFNSHREAIEARMRERKLDVAVPGRSYRDYAMDCIRLSEEVFDLEQMREQTDFLAANWYSTPTPLGAELEFSFLGSRAVYADPGEDSEYDSFQWFQDFDLQRRTWRLGGHVDSHRALTAGSLGRRRGFLEYALGRFNIAGDLSRPLFDCPWAMSLVINQAVKFSEVPPHSLHLSMELKKPGGKTVITDKPHRESDLACLLMLGGDFRKDADGVLREWRIFNNELDTNGMRTLNFSDRKHHYCRADDESSASDVMEYKFLRLKKEDTDYTRTIVALKGYQFETNARPVTIPRLGSPELPEQIFLRKWAEHPQPVSDRDLNSFVETVERGMLRERSSTTLGKRRKNILENIYTSLKEQNERIGKES